MKRYMPDGGSNQTRRAPKVALVVLVLVLIIGVISAFFIKSKIDERNERQAEYEKTAGEPAATVNYTLTPGTNMFKLRTYLESKGFSSADIEAAIAEELTYFNSNLPTGFSEKVDTLEGLFFPETLEFYETDTARTVLNRFIAEQMTVVAENDLIAKYEKQGLTLYQGLILASVVQSEVSDPADQKQVAQVFLKRFRESVMLGSDVTAIYAADLQCFEQTGAACASRDMSILKIDSPYNTRRYRGLPPSPIATSGLSALLAVAEPATGDYLYFLSGDDDVTYFARTEREHEANRENHCQVKCASL
ncbi:MAG: endolytic transglycosylase MltG [Candidatus Nomurabacteria bacterium]|jgi:UPF0755 protein|nr:endolytic transglycosylase MltG [Candidatus Nomurabacteria bacterium]